MSSLAPHPARSPEFLSRLLDGELTAAERAQFESHRAHCAECRRAASEFESALALFRSSHPRPAAADLSTRILRKLQAGNRRRSSFGVSFGIDLRWAGAFAAALLAVLIGSTVVVRREAAQRRLASESAPIPVTMERDRSVAGSAKEPASAPAPPAAPPQSSARASEPAREGALEDKPALREYASSEALKSSSADEKLAGGNARAKDKLEDNEASRLDADNRMNAAKPSESKFEAQSGAARQAAAPRPPAAAAQGRVGEKAGGEGAYALDGVADSAAARPSLKILAGDDWGSVPTLLNAAQIDLPLDLRGREFVIVVEASGRVREVQPIQKSLQKRTVAREEERAQVQAWQEKADKDSEALRSLRFVPGDRPRRLRVSVE
jgi:hypothetical protein